MSRGQVITFYSYKGGTGRTMALANVASLLAGPANGDLGGKRVLMVDWDLEAPGLHRFFHDWISEEARSDARPGLLDLFEAAGAAMPTSQPPLTEETVAATWRSIDLARFVTPTRLDGLHLLKAGSFTPDYSDRVNRFGWETLFDRAPAVYRALAARLAADYDFVLLDSRTGSTDIGSICTLQMPDRLVVVFTPNQQSMTGVLRLVERVTAARMDDPDDLRPLTIFPLLSRFEPALDQLVVRWRRGDSSAGIEGYQPLFEKALGKAYGMERCDLEEYFESVHIQHVPEYAYGEQLPVLTEQGGGRLSLKASYEAFARKLIGPARPWESQAAAAAAAEDPIRRAELEFAKMTPQEQARLRFVLVKAALMSRTTVGGDFLVRTRFLVPLSTGEYELAAGLRTWPRLVEWLKQEQISAATKRRIGWYVPAAIGLVLLWAALPDSLKQTVTVGLGLRAGPRVDPWVDEFRLDPTRKPLPAKWTAPQSWEVVRGQGSSPEDGALVVGSGAGSAKLGGAALYDFSGDLKVHIEQGDRAAFVLRSQSDPASGYRFELHRDGANLTLTGAVVAAGKSTPLSGPAVRPFYTRAYPDDLVLIRWEATGYRFRFRVTVEGNDPFDFTRDGLGTEIDAGEFTDPAETYRSGSIGFDQPQGRARWEYCRVVPIP